MTFPVVVDTVPDPEGIAFALDGAEAGEKLRPLFSATVSFLSDLGPSAL